MERIVNTELGVIREPLRAPFGFKGGTLSELWQTAVRLTLDSGASGMGVGVQSVLWSDPVTFCACDEAGGNERMLAVTRRALELLQGQAFTDPPGMTAGLVPELLAFARRLLGRADVPQTFVLNALVPVDFALWQLWNAKRGNGTFDALCASFCPELTNREKELGSIPLITYHTPEDELHALLETARTMGYQRVICAFQPHTYTRTKALFDDFVRELRTVDLAVLTDIYAAREQNKIGVSSADLAAQVPGSVYCPSLPELTDYLASAARPGDLILTVGAGDVYKSAERLVARKD